RAPVAPIASFNLSGKHPIASEGIGCPDSDASDLSDSSQTIDFPHPVQISERLAHKKESDTRISDLHALLSALCLSATGS
ncbi:hypothetical protein, partial [Pseudomonas sp.]|uniref:hypothetical protein n=1 Tax=Pseudomonas sp. TaxID=306 RepID=UPI00405404B9